MTAPFDGPRLKTLRLERAWSQEQLAAVSGLSVRTVQRLEQGGKASLETLQALAAAFRLPVDSFRSEAASEPSPTPMESSPMSTTANTEALSSPTPAEKAPTPDARARFLRHVTAFALIMAGLAAFNLIRHPDHLWFIYPLLGWGIPLAWRGIGLFFAPRA